MEMQEIPNSSMLSHVGYSPEDRILRVQFKNGGAYDYQDVPPEMHRALMKAESIGGHFCKEIKNKFSHSKVTA